MYVCIFVCILCVSVCRALCVYRMHVWYINLYYVTNVAMIITIDILFVANQSSDVEPTHTNSSTVVVILIGYFIYFVCHNFVL